MQNGELAAANQMLETLSLAELLAWMQDAFPSRSKLIAVSGRTATLSHIVGTSLGKTQPVDAVFVDNGLNAEYSPTTLPYIATQAEYGLTHGYLLHTYQTTLTPEALRRDHPLWDMDGTDDNMAARYKLKKEPLERAIKEHQAKNNVSTTLLLSGARRDDQESRAHLPMLDYRGDHYVLYLLATMSQEKVDAYDARFRLPRNDAHFDPLKAINGECGLVQVS